MYGVREAMLEATDDLDPTRLPPGFEEAQRLLRTALTDTTSSGIPDVMLAAALISEAMLRLVGNYGPAHTARIRTMFAACLEVSAPSSRQ